VNQITLLKYPDRVLVLYGRIKASSIIINQLRPNVVFNFVSVCKVSKINVKYVTCICAKRAIVRVCFISVYVFASAATFNTVSSFFLQTRRL
jgi:hypothetical protein